MSYTDFQSSTSPTTEPLLETRNPDLKIANKDASTEQSAYDNRPRDWYKLSTTVSLVQLVDTLEMIITSSHTAVLNETSIADNNGGRIEL